MLHDFHKLYSNFLLLLGTRAGTIIDLNPALVLSHDRHDKRTILCGNPSKLIFSVINTTHLSSLKTLGREILSYVGETSMVVPSHNIGISAPN